MARKKKKVTNEKDTAAIIQLLGGPRDGEEMRVSNPPSPYMRLTAPSGTWALYRRKGGSLLYEYDGTELPPQEEREQRRKAAWG